MVMAWSAKVAPDGCPRPGHPHTKPQREQLRPLVPLYGMMKIYHLGNCGTCQRILAEIPKIKRFEQQEIKTQPITAAQLDEMKKMAGSYEALFSKIAMKYRSMGLNEMTLTEKDFRKYILEEYTFLKRPTIIIGDQIFIGSAPKTVKAMMEAAAK
jgi:arsenate reductase